MWSSAPRPTGKPVESRRRIPRQARSRAKVEAVVEAFPRVVAEHGFHRATTTEIAREADVAVATLYQYFGSKEDVLAAYLEREVERHMRTIETLAVAVDVADPGQAMRALLGQAVGFAHRHRDLLRQVLFEVPGVLETPSLLRVEERIVDVARAFGASRPELAEVDDVDRLVWVLIQTVYGFLLRVVIAGPGGLGREEITDELDGLVNGYLRERGVELRTATRR